MEKGRVFMENYFEACKAKQDQIRKERVAAYRNSKKMLEENNYFSSYVSARLDQGCSAVFHYSKGTGSFTLKFLEDRKVRERTLNEYYAEAFFDRLKLYYSEMGMSCSIHTISSTENEIELTISV